MFVNLFCLHRVYGVYNLMGGATKENLNLLQIYQHIYLLVYGPCYNETFHRLFKFFQIQRHYIDASVS